MHVRRILGRAFGALLLIIGVVVAAATPAYALGTITVDNATVTEGTNGLKSLVFQVEITVPNLTDVRVDYTTVDGTATAATPQQAGDYTATSGTLVIPAGDVSGQVTVPVTTDAFPEPNEAFQLQLSNPQPTGTLIADGVATGTIQNDDGTAPSLRVNNVVASEAAPSLDFVVSLNMPAPQPTTVGYTTVGNTATIDEDFAPTSGTATIGTGQSSAVVSVGILGDELDEPNETLSLVLTSGSARNATIADDTGSGTIVDDDDPPTVTVSSPSVGESGGTLTFDVTLDAASAKTASFAYDTEGGGTATAGADHTAETGTVVFSAGEVSETITVAVTDDEADEPNETVILALSEPVNLVLGQPTATGTIVDDEDVPTLSIANATVDEGDTGSSNATLTVSLSAASAQTVTVEASTVPGTTNPATAGADYTAVTAAVVTFAAGETTQTVDVPVLGDALDEFNETLVVTLANSANAKIGDGSGLLTITDDDATPTLTIADTSVGEGDAGVQVGELTLSLSAASGRTVSVAASTGSGTALSGVDFGPQSGTVLTIAAGQTSTTLDVDVYGDQLPEADETFAVVLSGAQNVTIVDNNATVTITDDDFAQALSIDDVALPEGDPPGDTTFPFTVTLSSASTETVTVDFATADGSATAGAGSDYEAASGTLTFTAGQTEKTINVAVHRDDTPEANESFAVQLSNPTNADLADPSGAGTILNDDDPPPTASVADVSVGEGDGTATVTVTLSASSPEDVTVDLSAEADTASSPEDFTAVSTTVSIPAGQTTGTTDITIADDALDELDETFTVHLANATNATIGDGTAVVTIVDDDTTPAALSVGDATAAEGDPATVTVTLSEAAISEVSVQLTTADGTASSTDYTSVSTTVIFAAGDTSEQVEVPTSEDTLDEDDETVAVELSNPTGGASITDGTGLVTITDDDASPTVSIGDVLVTEGDTDTKPAELPVVLSEPSGQVITVRVTTSHLTTNANDVAALVDDVVTFQPGVTAASVTSNVNGDSSPEATEYLKATLSQPDGTTISDGTGITGITDDDPAGTYNPVTPARLLDTRKGVGRPGTSPVPGGQTVVLDVTGRGGIPTSGVAAVVVNVAVVQPLKGGHVTVTPSGGSSTSNVNFAAGETVANLVVVPIGGDGNIRIRTTQTTHIVADAFGWFATDAAPTPGSHLASLKPARLLDTRTGNGVPGGSTSPISSGTTRTLDVTGRGGVPSTGVAAVILSMAVTQPSIGSHLTVTPNGAKSTSNINYATGETAAGLVIVPVGGDGLVRYSIGNGSAHVVADVLGWFAAPGTLTGSVLTPVTPARLGDTRQDTAGPLRSDEALFVQVTGWNDVPENGVASAVVSLAVTQPSTQGFLSANRYGSRSTSNLNYAKGQTVANLAVVELDPTFGDFIVRINAGSAHVIADVFAWFSTPAP